MKFNTIIKTIVLTQIPLISISVIDPHFIKYPLAIGSENRTSKIVKAAKEGISNLRGNMPTGGSDEENCKNKLFTKENLSIYN
jgi:hypothetical protein